MDRIAAIARLARSTINAADAGTFELDALEAAVDLDVIGHCGLLWGKGGCDAGSGKGI